MRDNPLLSHHEIECVGERLAELSDQISTLTQGPQVHHPIRDLAASLGHRVNVTRRVPEPFFGFVSPHSGVIHVRPFRDVRVEDALIGHELLHPVLAKEHPMHGHADVWFAALATLAPRRLLLRLRRAGRLSAGEIAAEAGIPWWAADARLQWWFEKSADDDGGICAA